MRWFTVVGYFIDGDNCVSSSVAHFRCIHWEEAEIKAIGCGLNVVEVFKGKLTGLRIDNYVLFPGDERVFKQ
jgi:hypothetical protein